MQPAPRTAVRGAEGREERTAKSIVGATSTRYTSVRTAVAQVIHV